MEKEKMEEIRKMSDDELGGSIVRILGLPVKRWYAHTLSYKIPKSKAWHSISQICTKLDVVAGLEKLVIEKFGKYEYGEALIKLNGMSGSHLSGISSNGICEIAMSNARTRAEACLLALEGKDGK